jgi:hypothetical protein
MLAIRNILKLFLSNPRNISHAFYFTCIVGFSKRRRRKERKKKGKEKRRKKEKGKEKYSMEDKLVQNKGARGRH